MKLFSLTARLLILSCALITSACGETQSPQLTQETSRAAAIDSQVLAKWSRSCALCHVEGVAGAPKTGDLADWAPRLAQGEDVLLTHTVQGYNAMPPLGYCMSCERADLLAMIRFMSGADE